jgi:phosphatidylglycerophosphatase A
MSSESAGTPENLPSSASPPGSTTGLNSFPPPVLPKPNAPRPLDFFFVAMAQGFWVGRIPFMPGTWGSFLGLAWTALLLWGGNFWLFFAGTAGGLALSVWVSGAAESILGKRDPGSIVIDEIAAVPVCFLSWILLLPATQGSLPEIGYFLSGWNLAVVAGVFAAFRFFDILKPWPVEQSQNLPGGWGVTLDDLLAAIYVNGMFLAAWAFKSLF